MIEQRKVVTLRPSVKPPLREQEEYLEPEVTPYNPLHTRSTPPRTRPSVPRNADD